MRAVSSGTDGTGCGRRSDMGDLWTRKPSNAMAPHKAADFANGVRSLSDTQTRRSDVGEGCGQEPGTGRHLPSSQVLAQGKGRIPPPEDRGRRKGARARAWARQ